MVEYSDEIGGTTRSFSDSEYEYSYLYSTGVHGYEDTSPYNVGSNELNANGIGNRWYIQSWFDQRPTITSSDGYGREVEVRPHATGYYCETIGNNGWDEEFLMPNPDQSAIDNDTDYSDSLHILTGGIALSAGPVSLGDLWKSQFRRG